MYVYVYMYVCMYVYSVECRISLSTLFSIINTFEKPAILLTTLRLSSAIHVVFF